MDKKDFNFQEALVVEIKFLIERTKDEVFRATNRSLTLLNWDIGHLIEVEILKEERADYGKQILATLSQELKNEYGRGYDYSSLTRMVKFYKAFPEYQIVATLSQELSWSHFVELITLESEEQRMFYAQLGIQERWGVRLLRERINSMLFERTALSKRPKKLIQEELSAINRKGITNTDLVFRDPYLLDFLGLKETYSERDLEDAILIQLQEFLIELGSDFAFLGKQKRITIDGTDYYIDLLFYHRGLKCLVAIDLKLGKFQAADKGQMELYLRWLEKYEVKEDENSPIGLILCSDKSEEHVELMLLNEGRIKVAQYYTQLPPMEVLKAKLHRAIEVARKKES
ncbi:MAG: DUF1016 domain-containing protein [Bacteroidia bacterium]|nr:DUF1016 domain-containing protein [Bacteroidia bacterium]